MIYPRDSRYPWCFGQPVPLALLPRGLYRICAHHLFAYLACTCMCRLTLCLFTPCITNHEPDTRGEMFSFVVLSAQRSTRSICATVDIYDNSNSQTLEWLCHNPRPPSSDWDTGMSLRTTRIVSHRPDKPLPLPPPLALALARPPHCLCAKGSAKSEI